MSNPLMNANVLSLEEKPTHYLNLNIVDAEGNKYRVNTGIPLGGKYEKKLTGALLKAFSENPEKEFQLVGTINSATTEVVSEDVTF